MSVIRKWAWLTLLLFAACTASGRAVPQSLLTDSQGLIERAQRTVFLIPFSHWDTDWHGTFDFYSQLSNRNIQAAIDFAKQEPRYRYTLEQVAFVKHFWETTPAAREDLRTLVRNRQLSFAWAGITQPETSLVAPSIQQRNLDLGRQWISETFGPEFVPNTAWQSDAFGNSALFPFFLQENNIPYLFIGRSQDGCNPNRQQCTPSPHAFYWRPPASDARVLVTYYSYLHTWGALYKKEGEKAQLAALRQVVDFELTRTDSKYLFLPLGFDFADPITYTIPLVDRWNRENSQIAMVLSDPQTAFEYLATQELPEVNKDFNPIWQGFYASRPQAKIADKESDYLLTAGYTFGAWIDAPASAAWYTATFNAHYDNIGAVSFDKIWNESQRPRFEQTVATAARDLSTTLTQISQEVPAPLLVFNPSAWPRSEVIELRGDLPDLTQLKAPIQHIDADHSALYVAAAAPVSYTTSFTDPTLPPNPVVVESKADQLLLSNGLVSVTIDPALGATFASLQSASGHELIEGVGDDVVYFEDNGDIYGSRFGQQKARTSNQATDLTLLAAGPLLARVQAVIVIGGQLLTKTVTLRANSPAVEVTLDLKALPQTTVIVQTPLTISSTVRTDDLGLAAFTHPIDNSPIISGDITYRRKMFYPIMYWADVTDNLDGATANADRRGLTLITHGLQGLGGTQTLNLMLVRWVEEPEGEGLSDPDYHTFRYAYLPRDGDLDQAASAQVASQFNQPLIPVWKRGEQIHVQLPFDLGE